MKMQLCNFDPAQYFFISKNIPSLVYYSHIPIIIICFLLSITLLLRGYRKLENQILSFLLTSFGLWVFLSLIFWASNRSDVIMFVWAITILIEPLVYICGLYLVRVLINGKDITLKGKFLILLPYLPEILLLPTNLTLSGFDIYKCLSVEGPIALYYSYAIEIIYLCLTIFFAITQIRLSRYLIDKKRIFLFSIGVILFLITFSWGNIIGSFTDNWRLGEFGLFGMPIFITFLMYSIVNFNLFELKLIGKDVLVFALWILIGSLIVITDIDTSRIVTSITFILSLILGLIIIKSTQKEAGHLTQISSLATSLQELNSTLNHKVAEQTAEIKKSYEQERKARRDLEKLTETKDQFIMIAQHNLRVPATNISHRLNNIIARKLGNGEMDTKNLEDINNAISSAKHLEDIADDFRNIAKMKVGSQILNLSTSTLKPILESVLSELKIDSNSLNITISYPTDVNSWTELNIDVNKIREVILVIIDNAIRYNIQDGNIRIKTNSKNNVFKMTVENTGIGITISDKENLLGKSFYRSKKSKDLNPTGMGIGLSLSRGIIEAHHGTITIDSKGEDLGAVVSLTIPYNFLANI